jgi:uncharacterized spore protein YtfJ
MVVMHTFFYYIKVMAIEKFAETLLEKLRFITQAETVIGQPIQAGSATVVPVSRVSVGFGLGGHAGKGELTASGGGASVEPVAFLYINGEDVRIMPITKDSSLASKVMDIVPDVVNKFSKKKEEV